MSTLYDSQALFCVQIRKPNTDKPGWSTVNVPMIAAYKYCAAGPPCIGYRRYYNPAREPVLFGLTDDVVIHGVMTGYILQSITSADAKCSYRLMSNVTDDDFIVAISTAGSLPELSSFNYLAAEKQAKLALASITKEFDPDQFLSAIKKQQKTASKEAQQKPKKRKRAQQKTASKEAQQKTASKEAQQKPKNKRKRSQQKTASKEAQQKTASKRVQQKPKKRNRRAQQKTASKEAQQKTASKRTSKRAHQQVSYREWECSSDEGCSSDSSVYDSA